MSLSDVTIGIGTFLRPGYKAQALSDCRAHLPECKVVVADDSGDLLKNAAWNDPTRFGFTVEATHQWAFPQSSIHMPFDSGICAKRNACIKATKTKYFLLGTDDFDFSTRECRDGILKLVKVLDENPDIDVAVGRFHNNPYEGFIEWVPGSHIREHRLVVTEEREFHQIELGVNYFLARTDRMVQWDERFKIGGEHVDWFLDMKEAGRKVVWVPGVNINEQPLDMSKLDPRYPAFRARCWDGHKLMKEKRDIKQYIDFGGGIS